MNGQDLYTFQVALVKARDRLAAIKARKIELRQDRMPPWAEFNLKNQFEKLWHEELEELGIAYNDFMQDTLAFLAEKLLEELADCSNVIDGIAYQVMKEVGEV